MKQLEQVLSPLSAGFLPRAFRVRVTGAINQKLYSLLD